MPGSLARLFCCCAFLTAVSIAPCAADDTDFYRGKQIDLVVGTDPGASYDLFARIVSRIMSKYIPGNPVITVRYMPGAGGLTVSNWLYNLAPRDGTAIAASTQSVPIASLLDPTGVRYDPTKFNWIGSLTKDVFVAYTWETSKIKKLDDLRTTEGVFGANGIGSGGIDFPLVVRDILGLKLKVIPGYTGQPAVKLAMERGELDGSFGNGWGDLNATEPTWVRDGKINIIAQFGFEPYAAIPAGVPVILDLAKTEADREAIRLVTARQEFAKPYIAPPGVPADRIKILRDAFQATIHDPDFAEDTKKANLAVYQPMSGEDLSALTLKLSQTPTPVIERIRKIFAAFAETK